MRTSRVGKLKKIVLYLNSICNLWVEVYLPERCTSKIVIGVLTSVSYLGVNIDIAQSWLHGLIWGLRSIQR